MAFFYGVGGAGGAAALAPPWPRAEDVRGAMVPESFTEPLGEAAPRMVGDTHAAGPTRGRLAPGMHHDFAQYVAGVRRQVEARLVSWLDARVAEARDRGVDVAVVADGIRQLTLRGGKRMRAVLLAATYEACGGERGA